VFERRDTPLECLVEIRGPWFSFAPDWQASIVGGLLDLFNDSLILKDARGEIVLPADLGYVTYEGSIGCELVRVVRATFLAPGRTGASQPGADSE
jgi:hypothetical protein